MWYNTLGNVSLEVCEMAEILRISVGDILELKKPHPCNHKSVHFRVMRVGSDIRIVCEKCGRDLTLPRIKLEKSIKRITRSDEASNDTKTDTTER